MIDPENPSLRLQRQTFLRLDGRMQTGRPAPILRDAALELIDGLDGAVFHQIIDVAPQQLVRVQRILNGGEQREVLCLEQVAATKRRFHGSDAGVGQRDIPAVFVEREVAASAKMPCDAVHLICQHVLPGVAACDHQWNTRLVDQDRIGLVDHRRGERQMHLLARVEREPIAKKIEPDLVGCGVGDVAGVGLAAFFDPHALLDASYGKPKELIDTAHPLRVAAGQIIVHGHYVNAFAFPRVPGDRGHRRQRLAFASLHFGDPPGCKSQRAL